MRGGIRLISHIGNTTGIALCQPDSTVVAALRIDGVTKIRSNRDELMNATEYSILNWSWRVEVFRGADAKPSSSDRRRERDPFKKSLICNSY
jgi:hypothetical protein